MSDVTGRRLRAIQHGGTLAIDEVYADIARRVTLILRKHLSWPNGRRQPPVLTQTGRQRAMQEITAVFLGSSAAQQRIIAEAIAATERMAIDTEEEDQ